MKKYFKIEIETFTSEERERLIADLAEINFYAFDEEQNFLNAYINEDDFDEDELRRTLKDQFNFTRAIIEEENWNTQWESSIQPVIVNDFVAIRPSFHEPVKNVKHDLIITPKMSFGTGHHATTFLMISLMEKTDFRNKRVLDFGTGTGVLAILAEKSGALEIIAVDNDEWSIRNSTENIQTNHCERIRPILTDDIKPFGNFDMILANINLNVLSGEADSISGLLNQGGELLVSGFLIKDETDINNLFETKNIIKIESLQREGWMATLFKKPGKL